MLKWLNGKLSKAEGFYFPLMKRAISFLLKKPALFIGLDGTL